MPIKLYLLFISLIKFLWEIVTWKISENYDKKPLPEEVAHIYEPERYRQYLDKKRDNRRISRYKDFVMLLYSAFVYLSPFYSWMEKLAGDNLYVIVLVTVLVYGVIRMLLTLPFSWYETFVIDEKYGLNKLTKMKWLKDQVVRLITLTISGIMLYEIIAFFCEWAKLHRGKEASFGAETTITIGLCFILVIVILVLCLGAMQLISLRISYKFTDLEDGELKDWILGLLEGCKKKVRRIRVYNESSKSTSKNAFLFSFMGYREISIADNFLAKNEDDELMAVMAHEIGHLKYKKSFGEYIFYAIIVALLGVMWWILTKVDAMQDFGAYIRRCFGLQYTNYHLIAEVSFALYSVISAFQSICMKHFSRKQEYAADRNAVQEGYGEAMKNSFIKMSNDELKNVNPAPIIEFTEYSHPGMYNRIKAINEEMERLVPAVKPQEYN